MSGKGNKLAELAAKRRAEEEKKAAPAKKASAPASKPKPSSAPGGKVSGKELERRENELEKKLMRENRGKNLDEYDVDDGFLVDDDEEEPETDDDDDDEEEEYKSKKKSSKTSKGKASASKGKKRRKDSDSDDDEPRKSKSKKKEKSSKKSKKSKKDDDDDDDSADDDDDEDLLDEIDTSVIIQSSRRTRGKQIDYTQGGILLDRTRCSGRTRNLRLGMGMVMMMLVVVRFFIVHGENRNCLGGYLGPHVSDRGDSQNVLHENARDEDLALHVSVRDDFLHMSAVDANLVPRVNDRDEILAPHVNDRDGTLAPRVNALLEDLAHHGIVRVGVLHVNALDASLALALRANGRDDLAPHVNGHDVYRDRDALLLVPHSDLPVLVAVRLAMEFLESGV
ncbi:hypothetical protein HDU76_012633 [Blyttiomyces sp. JEL0837]|nr:hypothetical protein HDU76_012633 [Blyttiomyces sp. JEL0837]